MHSACDVSLLVCIKCTALESVNKSQASSQKRPNDGITVFALHTNVFGHRPGV